MQYELKLFPAKEGKPQLYFEVQGTPSIVDELGNVAYNMDVLVNCVGNSYEKLYSKLSVFPAPIVNLSQGVNIPAKLTEAAQAWLALNFPNT